MSCLLVVNWYNADSFLKGVSPLIKTHFSSCSFLATATWIFSPHAKPQKEWLDYLITESGRINSLLLPRLWRGSRKLYPGLEAFLIPKKAKKVAILRLPTSSDRQWERRYPNWPWSLAFAGQVLRDLLLAYWSYQRSIWARWDRHLFR